MALLVCLCHVGEESRPGRGPDEEGDRRDTKMMMLCDVKKCVQAKDVTQRYLLIYAPYTVRMDDRGLI